MPNRVVVSTVVVHRGSESVALLPGETFNFTESELADIERMMPDAVRTVTVASPVRVFENEQDSAEDVKAPAGNKKAAVKEQETL
jgi:hypothetical protein